MTGTNSVTKATFPSGVIAYIVIFVNRVRLASPKDSADIALLVNSLTSRRNQRNLREEGRHYVTTRGTIVMDASPGSLCLCRAFKERDRRGVRFEAKKQVQKLSYGDRTYAPHRLLYLGETSYSALSLVHIFTQGNLTESPVYSSVHSRVFSDVLPR